jgi:hypothetical protein
MSYRRLTLLEPFVRRRLFLLRFTRDVRLLAPLARRLLRRPPFMLGLEADAGLALARPSTGTLIM